MGEQYFKDISNTTFLPSWALSTSSVTWSKFYSSNFTITFFLLVITNLELLVSIFDIIYRVYQSLVTMKKYWGNTAVDIPQIDCRGQDRMSAIAKYFKSIEESRFLAKIMHIMPYIWFQCLLLCAFFALILWTLAGKSSIRIFKVYLGFEHLPCHCYHA